MSEVPEHVWGNVPEGVADGHCGAHSLLRSGAEHLHPELLLTSEADEGPAGQPECSPLRGAHRDIFVLSSHLEAQAGKWEIYCQISSVWPLYQV